MVDTGLGSRWCPVARTGRGGAMLATLALAGCLPQNDLASYSRGAEDESASAPDASFIGASLEPTASDLPVPVGREPEPSSPTRPGSGTPRAGARGEPASAPPERPDEPALPADTDAGVPEGPVPEACLQLDGDAGTDNGSCYALSRAPLSWTAALAACEDWGGSLVSITSEAEDVLLGTALSGTVWIGANDRQTEGTFVWANADPFELAAFAPGEPDNTFGIQDCIERRADGLWNDRACSVQNVFVCERPRSP